MNHNCCCRALDLRVFVVVVAAAVVVLEKRFLLFFSFFFWGFALFCFVLFCFGFCLFCVSDRFADVDGRSHLETNCSFRQFMRDAWVVMVVLVLQFFSGLMCVQRHRERERERSFDELGGTEALVLGCGSISFASFYVSTTVRDGRRDLEVAVAIE